MTMLTSAQPCYVNMKLLPLAGVPTPNQIENLAVVVSHQVPAFGLNLESLFNHSAARPPGAGSGYRQALWLPTCSVREKHQAQTFMASVTRSQHPPIPTSGKFFADVASGLPPCSGSFAPAKLRLVVGGRARALGHDVV